MERNCFDRLNGFTIALRDGEWVDFRPVKPDDGQIIQNGMYALSAKSRYFRFFCSISQLSDARLHYFTEVDQQDHVAWIAQAHDTAEHPGVGIARFIRFEDRSQIAEFAVTVIDSYQKRGLGTMLMAVLYVLAQAQGIKILRAFVLPENSVAMHWLARLGAIGKFENGVCQMDIAVDSDLSSFSTPPLLQYFAECQQQMKPLRNQYSS